MHRGFVSGNKNGGVKLWFAFVLGDEKYMHLWCTSDHVANMVDKLVVKVL